MPNLPFPGGIVRVLCVALRLCARVFIWGNNCFASWLCTGEAIRVEQ
jgi:hypothetical protein